jgi:cytoskeletal protein CcmA (bactofilin family)
MMDDKKLVPVKAFSFMKAKDVVPSADKHKITSLIAKNAKFRGDMLLQESIHINGSLQGNIVIEGEGMLINLSDCARVEGNIRADIVIIAGTVIGNIEGKLVKLHASARVDGDIVYQRILVDDGATINSSNMSKVTGQTFTEQTLEVTS